MYNYAEEIEYVSALIKNAYSIYFDKNRREIRSKGTYDLVTEADIAIEKYIIQEILKKYPDDNIHSEEENSHNEIIDRTWVIDPIDGTFNMANGIEIYGMQCALFENNNVVMSIIFLPLYNEVYTAVRGVGAYLNGMKLCVKKKEIFRSVVSFGDFQHKRECDRNAQIKIMSNICDKVAKIRMLGAASVDFANLASGRTDGVVIFTKNMWDIAPGILLCRESGCIVKAFDGKQYNFDSNGLIVSPCKELINLISGK